MKMLSFGNISTSLKSYPGSPSTFSLKCELSPPPSLIDVRILSLFGLYSSICLLTDRGSRVVTLVKTVSNQRVSVFTSTWPEVVNDSFLQEETPKYRRIDKSKYLVMCFNVV